MSLNLEKIHEDERGEIYLLKGDSLKQFAEITLFTTKAGYVRGGCIHRKSNEYNMVLDGDIIYFLGDIRDHVEKYDLKAGDRLEIEKNTPHYFISKTDSIVIEFGASTEEKMEKEPITRAIVDKINEIKKINNANKTI